MFLYAVIVIEIFFGSIFLHQYIRESHKDESGWTYLFSSICCYILVIYDVLSSLGGLFR